MARPFVNVEIKGIKRLRREFADKPRKLYTVLRRAVNRTGITARKRIVQAIRQELNVKAGDLKQRNVRLHKARGRNLGAKVDITGGRIPLIRFGARQTRRGVSYAIHRGRRKRIANAFVSTMSSGHQGVFRRIGKSRLPITELHGPSIPVGAQDAIDRGRVKGDIRNDLAKNVDSQVKHALRSK